MRGAIENTGRGGESRRPSGLSVTELRTGATNWHAGEGRERREGKVYLFGTNPHEKFGWYILVQ